MIEEEEQRGFGERPVTGFEPSLESRVAFHRFALVVYDFRCAVSGLQFPATEGALHDRLEVVPIHPREAEGPLEISNVLVLESRIAHAFAKGWICVDDGYRVVIADRAELGDELSGQVIERRALFLPSDPLFRPASRHFQFHRMVVARYSRG
ncbi:hypothetical protein SAMN05216456_0658 [Devosia crocina]|uniref:HNH endonuclease n=1 Tax=Devosia crocina TaxID=429728 RepID=A0A1I7N2Y7_9HYPH|nr:hypothetical protein [Devosia crocina]SFV29040.1 hypothetical protein SAMN05216456_0658 [Devosia crocina]